MIFSTDREDMSLLHLSLCGYKADPKSTDSIQQLFQTSLALKVNIAWQSINWVREEISDVEIIVLDALRLQAKVIPITPIVEPATSTRTLKDWLYSKENHKMVRYWTVSCLRVVSKWRNHWVCPPSNASWN